MCAMVKTLFMWGIVIYPIAFLSLKNESPMTPPDWSPMGPIDHPISDYTSVQCFLVMYIQYSRYLGYTGYGLYIPICVFSMCFSHVKSNIKHGKHGKPVPASEISHSHPRFRWSPGRCPIRIAWSSTSRCRPGNWTVQAVYLHPKCWSSAGWSSSRPP